MKNLHNLLKVNLLLFGAISLLVGCGQSEPESTEQVSRPIKLFTVGQMKNGLVYRYPGSVSSIKETVLAFEVPGKITQLNVKEGELVEQGQVLAQIDARDYEAQLSSAESDLTVAKSDFQRYEKAFKANAVTAQALQQAKRNMEVALSAFNQASKALAETKLVAPFTGRIVTKEIEQFATVYAKQPIMQLHSESAYEMVVNVPEIDWAQGERVKSASEIKLENQLFVSISAIPNKQFAGTITEFSGKADSVTRTYEVTVAFTVPESTPISSGMTGNVIYNSPIESITSLSVPLDSVVGNSDNKTFVWLYDAANGTVKKQFITLGNITDTSVFVLSGLSKGDQIAVSGVNSLYDGYLVHPMKD